MFSFRKSNVFIAGTVHLDSLISRDLDSKIRLSNGEEVIPRFANGAKLIHSVGGSGYNVASNLCQSPHRRWRVELYTLLPKGAALTQAIVEKSKKIGIRTHNIRRLQTFSDHRLEVGGFVALLDTTDEEIRYAASTTNLRFVDLFADRKERLRIQKGVRNAHVVIVDTNLQAPTIREIQKYCRQYDVPLFVGLVATDTSEQLGKEQLDYCEVLSGRKAELIAYSKARQPKNALDGRSIEILNAIFSHPDQEISPDLVEAVCKYLGSNVVICLDAESGYLFLAHKAGQSYKYWYKPMEVAAKTGNPVGERDAVLSGYLEWFLSNNRSCDLASEVSKLQLGKSVQEVVSSVVHTPGATPGSMISFDDLSTVGTLSGRIARYQTRAAALKLVGQALYWSFFMILFLSFIFGIESPVTVWDLMPSGLLDWWKNITPPGAATP